VGKGTYLERTDEYEGVGRLLDVGFEILDGHVAVMETPIVVLRLHQSPPRRAIRSWSPTLFSREWLG